MDEKIKVKILNKSKFTALVSHSRSPAADYISKEIAWFSSEDENILGVVLLDTVDNDFVSLVLGKDKENVYGTIDVQASIETYDEALKLTHT